MGPDPPDGAGPEQLPAQGRATAYWESSKAERGGKMGIYSAGGSDVRVKLRGD